VSRSVSGGADDFTLGFFFALYRATRPIFVTQRPPLLARWVSGV
jgi:hypothetical protein